MHPLSLCSTRPGCATNKFWGLRPGAPPDPPVTPTGCGQMEMGSTRAGGLEPTGGQQGGAGGGTAGNSDVSAGIVCKFPSEIPSFPVPAVPAWIAQLPGAEFPSTAEQNRKRPRGHAAWRRTWHSAHRAPPGCPQSPGTLTRGLGAAPVRGCCAVPPDFVSFGFWGCAGGGSWSQTPRVGACSRAAAGEERGGTAP